MSSGGYLSKWGWRAQSGFSGRTKNVYQTLPRRPKRPPPADDSVPDVWPALPESSKEPAAEPGSGGSSGSNSG